MLTNAILRNNTGFEISFRYQSIDDNLSRTIAQYEPPYTDGAYSDDLGASPRRIQFAAIFRDSGYADHFGFVNAIESYNKLWDLMHPVYGNIRGRILSAVVRHAKSNRHCSINIEFFETIDVPPPRDYINIAKDTETKAVEGLSLLAQLIISSDASKIEPDWYAQLQSKVLEINATAAKIASPIDAIGAKVRYLTGVPGEVAAAVVGVLESVVVTCESIANTPEMINAAALQMQQTVNLVDRLLDTPERFKTNLKMATKTMYAMLTMAYLGRQLQSDQDKRNIALTRESLQTIDIEGTYTPPRSFNSNKPLLNDDHPFNTSIELEELFYVQAEIVRNAMVDIRQHATDPILASLLLSQTRAVTHHINNMKIQVGQIRYISIPPMPIFTLLRREGLPYKAADRIHALNPDIINPIFYAGEVRIYEQ